MRRIEVRRDTCSEKDAQRKKLCSGVRVGLLRVIRYSGGELSQIIYM
jgi:hypothetical protein